MITAVPQSRRDRPAKPPLSRAGIVATTIGIARQEGLAKATMRRVAQALDTGPASLYVYVANTTELHAAVLDELLATLGVRPEGSWEDRLVGLLENYRDLLSGYPGLARSALVIRPSGPHFVGFVDQLLGLLLEGGAEPARAAWGVDLLILLVTASAAEHNRPGPDDPDVPAGEAEWNTLTRAVRGADPSVVPHVAAHAQLLLAGPPDRRWAWAIRVLVQGTMATPVPTSLTAPPDPTG